jgi:hypothetical protein
LKEILGNELRYQEANDAAVISVGRMAKQKMKKQYKHHCVEIQIHVDDSDSCRVTHFFKSFTSNVARHGQYQLQ